MIVGVSTIEIYIPQSTSLKEKRKILNRIKSRIKNKFNVSISEVGYIDKWQRALLGVSTVSNSTRMVDSVLSGVLREIGSDLRVEIIDYKMDIRV